MEEFAACFAGDGLVIWWTFPVGAEFRLLGLPTVQRLFQRVHLYKRFSRGAIYCGAGFAVAV